jgi:hypothetical protein
MMNEPILTSEQIRAIVDAASQALGTDLYGEETPGMRAILRMNDLFAQCLNDLPDADQRFSVTIEHADRTVELRATPAARAAIAATYPAATWYAIFTKLEEQP